MKRPTTKDHPPIKKATINLVEQGQSVPLEKKSSSFIAIEKIAVLKNIEIGKKIRGKESYMIKYRKNKCQTCYRNECKTSKIKISGNFVVIFCDDSSEKQLGVLSIDNDFINHVDSVHLSRLILTNIEKYTDGDNGIVNLIEDIFINSLIKKRGSIIYIYNGTSKLWGMCNDYGYVAYIASTYIKELVLKTIDAVKKGKNDLVEGDVQSYRDMLALLSYLLSVTKKLNKMTSLVKVAIVSALEIEYPAGLPYHFPIRDCKVVDLRNGEITERHQDHFFTSESPYTYLGPDHLCPNMEKFMYSMFNGKDEVEYMQKLLGYFLSGDISDRGYYIFWGNGCNGKTVLMERILSKILLGFHSTLMSSALVGKSTNGATPELIPLLGSRLSSVSDEKLNVPLITRLTGDDTISARPLYGSPVTFKNLAKIVMITNHPPDLELDRAIVERTRMVPFVKTFVSEEEYNKLEDKTNYGIKDPEFINDLTTKHMDEVFTYLVNGAIKFFSEYTHNIPRSFMKSREDYLADNDNMAKFISDRCEVAAHYKVKSKDILKSYNEWAITAGTPQLNVRSIKRELLAKGYKYKKARVMYVFGLKVLPIDMNEMLADI